MSHMSLRSGKERQANPPRRQHWLRWVLGGLLAVAGFRVRESFLLILAPTAAS